MSDFQKEPYIDLAGGRIRCRRCQAMSIRREHSETVAYLRELEDVAWALGIMTGTRTRGPKPKNYRPVSTLEAAKRWIATDALGLRRKNNSFVSNA